jgi:hypothetical protein
MFDRVLDTVHEFEKKGFDKRLIEKIVLLYTEHGAEAARNKLLADHAFSQAAATDLVKRIDKKYVRDNRLILTFYSALFVLLLFLVVLGAVSHFYFLLVLSALFLIRRGIVLFRFIWRNKFRVQVLQ